MRTLNINSFPNQPVTCLECFPSEMSVLIPLMFCQNFLFLPNFLV